MGVRVRWRGSEGGSRKGFGARGGGGGGGGGELRIVLTKRGVCSFCSREGAFLLWLSQTNIYHIVTVPRWLLSGRR